MNRRVLNRIKFFLGLFLWILFLESCSSLYKESVDSSVSDSGAQELDSADLDLDEPDKQAKSDDLELEPSDKQGDSEEVAIAESETTSEDLDLAQTDSKLQDEDDLELDDKLSEDSGSSAMSQGSEQESDLLDESQPDQTTLADSSQNDLDEDTINKTSQNMQVAQNEPQASSENSNYDVTKKQEGATPQNFSNQNNEGNLITQENTDLAQQSAALTHESNLEQKYQEVDQTVSVSPEPTITDVKDPRVDDSAKSSVQSKKFTQPGSKGRVTVTDLQYRSYEDRGVFVVQATGPIEFESFYDDRLHQVVIDLKNVRVPRHLQRPFNMRDMPGDFGFVDIFMPKKAQKARLIVQLRPQAQVPEIQTDESALYIMAKGKLGQSQILAQGPISEETTRSQMDSDTMTSAEIQNSPGGSRVQGESPVEEASTLFSYESFEDFLKNNRKFTGRPITMEVENMELKEVLNLISEEVGINLAISDDVSGRISLKLNNVPWDQALVTILKAKKLGYTRVGNVLRIAPLQDIRQEEEENLKIQAAKRQNAPPLLKTVTINYMRPEDVERQVRPLLSQKGAVIVDARTNTIVISDLPDVVERVVQFIKTLDVPPRQVLIEGRIVEASDSFEKKFGIQWSTSGKDTSLSGLKANVGFNISPGLPTGSFGLNFRLGTLNYLGDLSAALALFETQGLVKVISSPRIMVLHNEQAEIRQSTEIPIITAIPVPGGGSPVPQVNFKQVQLRLQVTPVITNDGSVILKVDMSREIPGEVVDATTQARPVNSRSASTRVLVKNGQTAVIGGIYQNDISESSTTVPGLGKIPLLGWLFKSQNNDRRRLELLIFLTPRIVPHWQKMASDDFQGSNR